MRRYFTISWVLLVAMKTYCLLLFSIVALLGFVSCEKYYGDVVYIMHTETGL